MYRRKDSIESETTNGYMNGIISLPKEEDLDSDSNGYISEDGIGK